MEVDVAPYAPRSVLETLPVSLPTSAFEDLDFDDIAAPIVQSLSSINPSSFSSGSLWRDVFALTGTLRTIYSPEAIVKAWSDTCSSRQAQGFQLIEGSAKPMRLPGDVGWVNISFTFNVRGTPAASCRGFLSLALERDGQWRIWMMRTVLEQLDGAANIDELSIANEATTNGAHGHHTNGANGHPQHFEAIVIGAGQAGLGTAGRLQALGIRYLVLDKNAQIGDNWMTRYDSARLHTAREYNHLPFDRTFPLPYQEFLTKYDLARGYRDWVRKFGVESNIWFNTALESGVWDPVSQTYTLMICRDGATQQITTKNVIMATGSGGQTPIMPTLPGHETFRGTIMHSASFKNADAYRGKPGIVIGTANTAHDVAEDMVESSLSSITMVQRSRTYVLPCDYFTAITHRSYNENIPVVDADREGYTMPYAVTRLLSRKGLHAAAAKEPERFDALERVGFRVERFGDIMWHICEKLGGHYMDVGCSALIAQGKVRPKVGVSEECV
jgi:hypothetical protein